MSSLNSFIARIILVAGLASLISPAVSHAQGMSPELQQKVAAVKQSVAMNQQALRQYTWTETQQTLLKGDVKSTKVSQCQYAPDGTIQKTPLTAPPAPSDARGIRGRIIAKKTSEIEDYMTRVASLIKRYTPPSGSAMESSLQSGKVSIQPAAGGLVTLVFGDYALPGDSVKLTYDTTVKKIREYNVSTYLDSPSDVVTLNVVFASLPDGTNYVTQTVLNATAKQVQIRTTSAGYNKLQ
jgi:hypothetical protein